MKKFVSTVKLPLAFSRLTFPKSKGVAHWTRHGTEKLWSKQRWGTTTRGMSRRLIIIMHFLGLGECWVTIYINQNTGPLASSNHLYQSKFLVIFLQQVIATHRNPIRAIGVSFFVRILIPFTIRIAPLFQHFQSYIPCLTFSSTITMSSRSLK